MCDMWRGAAIEGCEGQRGVCVPQDGGGGQDLAGQHGRQELLPGEHPEPVLRLRAAHPRLCEAGQEDREAAAEPRAGKGAASRGEGGGGGGYRLPVSRRWRTRSGTTLGQCPPPQRSLTAHVLRQGTVVRGTATTSIGRRRLRVEDNQTAESHRLGHGDLCARVGV